MSSQSFSFDSYVMALELARSGVVDAAGFLVWKRFELEKLQSDKVLSGCRGVQIFIPEWVDAPARNPSFSKWPVDLVGMRKAVKSDVGEVIWRQEYRWSWVKKKYQYRGYWAPASFEHPTLCTVPDTLEIEEIQGCLGVNISNYPYSHLPAFPRTYGPRPTDPALELIYCQRYREEWEDLVLVGSRWETRWALRMPVIWHEC